MRSWTIRPCQTRLRGWSRAPAVEPPSYTRPQTISKFSSRPQRAIVYGHSRNQSTLTDSQSLVSLPHSPAKPNGDESFTVSQRRTSSRKEPGAWTELLEPLLPFHLSTRSVEDEKKDDTTSGSSITGVVEQAYKQYNIDLVSFLGIHEGRWDAALHVACAVIDSSKAPSQPWKIPDVTSSMKWPLSRRLDEISALDLTSEQIASDQHHDFRPRAQPTLNQARVRIENSLPRFGQPQHSDSGKRSRDLLGQIWLSLGRMVLAAAERNLHESTTILARVGSTLSRFHRHGYLPDHVLQISLNADPAALQQSPYVAEMSASILTTATPAALINRLASSAHNNDQKQGSTYDSDIATKERHIERHAPAQWLEYILWCCTHGGWLVEGATIVEEMHKRTGPHRWSLMYWRYLSITHSDGGANNTAKSHNPAQVSGTSAVSKTISTEVVIALADGLATTVEGVRPGNGHPLNVVTNKLHALRDVLDRDKMSLAMSTWEAFIVRIINSLGLQHLDYSPAVFEKLLDLAKTYGTEPNARNSPHDVNGEAEDFLSYVFEGSAAVLGLYHRAMLSCIRARDVSGALRILAALQNLTDVNKTTAVREFFAELKGTQMDSPSAPSQITFDSFPGVQFPSFFPSLPPMLVASLLDLLTDCNAIELGRWMIESADVDGPVIPESEYGNQVIAPALIRFAAATSDRDLLSKVTKAQSTTIAGRTLVALCESRIRQADFDSAAEVFNLIRIYSLHDWTPVDFCYILRVLILQIYKTEAATTSEEACSLCQRLLRGDLGQVWGTSLAQIDTIVEVLSSLDGRMAELCSNLLPRSQVYAANLPTYGFDMILDAAVNIWGSTKGVDMWQTWCIEGSPRQLSHGQYGDTQASRIQRPPSVAALFSAESEELHEMEDLNANKELMESSFSGSIKPSLSTLRIIVQQALKERRSEQVSLQEDESVAIEENAQASTSSQEVLGWAAAAFKSFGLSESDIDYELQGYLSENAGASRSKAYSSETLRIWTAFAGARRKWAQGVEESLRDLASIKSEQQRVYEDEPAAERFLLMSLAKDLNLHCEDRGQGTKRLVAITKAGQTRVPTHKIDDVLDTPDD